MPEIVKYVIDAAVGIALFFALLVVFVVDRFLVSPSTGGGAASGPNTLTNVVVHEDKSGRDLKRLKLAVTPTGGFKNQFTGQTDKWDDMSKLLTELGEGYKHDLITMEDVIAPRKLGGYDVVFLTCNGGFEDEMKGTLQEYVSKGGILYASDWRYDAIAKAFPEMVAPNLKGDGRKQELEADIVDPGLAEELKSKKIHLRFDLDEWKPAAFGGPRVKVLMQGSYLKYKAGGGPERVTAPLMVRFPVGNGTVVFTSFHNEKQNSRTEKQLLQYLVYSLVTAGVDAEVNKQMDQGGFTPQRSNLLSTPANQAITKEYKNDRAATLRFALAFRNEGAQLRFHIKSPDGKQYTWEGKSTVALEVPEAQPGVWTYTVTALNLPYANFPFTVTVGEKK